MCPAAKDKVIQRQFLWRNRAGIWSVPKYHVNILLGYFDAKLEKLYVFKLALGNKSWHENSNNIGVSVVKSAIRKNLQGSFKHWCWAAHLTVLLMCACCVNGAPLVACVRLLVWICDLF